MSEGRPRDRLTPVVAGVVLLGVLALFATASTATGSVAIRPAAGVPDPRPMVLTVRDLGGARVTSQGYYKDTDFPSAISYGRELEGGGLGGIALPYVDSEAEVGLDSASTARYLGTLKSLLGTRQGRALVAKSFASRVGGGGTVSRVRVGHPRVLGAGPGSFDLPMSVSLLGLRTEIHLAAFRIQQVLDALVVVGTPGKRIPRATLTKLAKIMVGRASAVLLPKSTGAPTVSGLAVVGQTLTATTGTWSGSPTGFALQWQRCDATGACADITGATARTYVVAAADVGATLRVTVTARSEVGSTTAASPPTAVVQATSAPVNTTPPSITGRAHPGETLTALPGTWAGSPTGFAFQWQRCDAMGDVCAAISGATGGTYVVSTGDLGATLRVVVTATNAAGSASATSSATAVVT